MLLTAEPPANMEKSSSLHPDQPPRPRMVPRKERDRGAKVPPRSPRQRPSKTGRDPEASTVRKERLQKKEKPETNDVTAEQVTEVIIKSTVVDIDSVREDEVKEENLGLLEAAEQEDGKSKPGERPGTLLEQWKRDYQCFYFYYRVV